MSFREQLAALVADDKKQAAEPLLEALDKQMVGYDSDIRELKKALREKDGIKPEDFAKLEQERDELTGKLTEAAKILKTLTKERDESTAKAQAESAANHKLLVDNGLTDALTRAGIRKEFLPAARALLKEKGIISVESDGDIRRAVVSVDGKPMSLDDYVAKNFAASDEGKAFIPANRDSGAGASGALGQGVPTDLDSKFAKALADGNADLALSIQGQMQKAMK